MFGPMIEIDPSNAACGNCNYWKGFRKKDTTGQKAMVDGNAKAKCNKKTSPWFDQIQLGLSTCPSWERWSNLK